MIIPLGTRIPQLITRIQNVVSFLESARAASAQLGVPRTTLQRLVAGVGTPSARTLARFEVAYARWLVPHTRGRTTTRTSIRVPDPDALAFVERPPDATSFALITASMTTVSGARSQQLIDFNTSSPEQERDDAGLRDEDVIGITWGYG